MSIRRRDVPPSQQIQIGDTVYPVVTQEDLIRAMTDAAIVVDLAGGIASLVVQRVPTGVEDERFTTRAIVTWQDRTNAKPQSEPVEVASIAGTEMEATAPPQDAAPQDAPPVERPPEGEPIPRPADPTPFDDGLSVDPHAVDESDPELRSAVAGG